MKFITVSCISSSVVKARTTARFIQLLPQYSDNCRYFKTLFTQRGLIKHIEVLTFSFSCLKAPVVAPSSWKSKDDAMCLQNCSFHCRQTEHHLGRYIVSMRNPAGVGWGIERPEGLGGICYQPRGPFQDRCISVRDTQVEFSAFSGFQALGTSLPVKLTELPKPVKREVLLRNTDDENMLQ